nr:hypothetical protein Q903MT_gene6518 [Picea sitchensis]
MPFLMLFYKRVFVSPYAGPFTRCRIVLPLRSSHLTLGYLLFTAPL